MILGRECQRRTIAIIRLTLTAIISLCRAYSADISTILNHQLTPSPLGSLIIISNRSAWSQMCDTVFGVCDVKTFCNLSSKLQ